MNIRQIYLPALLLLILPLRLEAQESKTVRSTLKEATVFFRGAELTHTATINLTRGDNEIRIEGLSPRIDANSLKIKATGGVVVAAYEYSIDYLTPDKSPTSALKAIQDSIDYYQQKLDKTEIDLKINKNMIEFLSKGITKNVSGSEKGLGIDELVKTMNYYKTKSEELETSQINLNKQKKELSNSITRLRSQRDQESTKGNKNSGVLKLTLNSARTVNSTFTITYYTPSAGWTPYFDINIASTDRPIVIAAKSKINQTTGFDWQKVKLTLSTATPSNGKVAPLFQTWLLEPVSPARVTAARKSKLMAQNSFSYEQASAEPNEVVAVRGSTLPETAHGKPLYIIDGAASTPEAFNEIDPSMIKDVTVLKDASATAIYGTRGANGVVVVTLKNDMDDYVIESSNAMNTVYNIDLPYTIPGNGKVQTIDLLTKETTAEYKYYCAPRLDGETYLLAEISGWEKLGLLNGKANITYDGTYVGETYINASSTQSKLALTLGTDKRVPVKREIVQDYSTKKSLGNDVQQLFTYKLTVKNNRNKPVKMVLKDQYPISTQKDIEVKLQKETTPWTANKEDVGVITWEEEFAAGETKVYTFGYSVKYPKDMKLNF